MALVVLGGLGSSTVGRAEEPRRLGYDLRVDIPVMAVAAGTALGLSAASGSLAGSCRWCASNGLDDAVRDALRRNDPAAARTASEILAVSSPFVGIGMLRSRHTTKGRSSTLRSTPSSSARQRPSP